MVFPLCRRFSSLARTAANAPLLVPAVPVAVRLSCASPAPTLTHRTRCASSPVPSDNQLSSPAALSGLPAGLVELDLGGNHLQDPAVLTVLEARSAASLRSRLGGCDVDAQRMPRSCVCSATRGESD